MSQSVPFIAAVRAGIGRGCRVAAALAAVAAAACLVAAAPARAVDLAWQRAFGSYGTGPGQFLAPTWVAASAGQVFVVDRDAHRVSAFAPSSAFVAQLGSEAPEARLAEPAGVAVDATGSVWVVDSEAGRLRRFSPAGLYQGAIGRRGRGDGAFLSPVDVAVDGEGALWVTDARRRDVQRLSADGGLLARFGGFGTGPGQFLQPGGIAVDRQGVVYVTDVGRVQKLSVSGAFLGSIGSYGSGPGQVEEPTDVAIDPRGLLYVADAGNNRVDLFTPSGAFLASLGSFGSGVGEFDRPIGVGVDAKGDVYVSDANNARVVRLGFGPDLHLGGPRRQSVAARRQVRFALAVVQPCRVVVTATLDGPWPVVLGRTHVHLSGGRATGGVRLSARDLAAIDGTRRRTHRPPAITLSAAAHGSFGITQPIQRVVLARHR